MNIYEKLCSYDKRNPDCILEEDEEKPREDCYCDNCFYGRHELAEIILDLSINMVYIIEELQDKLEI
jgi:hypothetical protein